MRSLRIQLPREGNYSSSCVAMNYSEFNQCTKRAHTKRPGHELRPNPSVNLTRNSVPHLPGMARYAHNALPGKRVTLPRAGYLKL
jgi:hypothetical protein